ncbi:S1C family serine protease [Streptomyces meridianus]|uniref:Trypsin-like peptidase domain-containing protein n=1 Tax=Streptomyces meridianus TaxID=2938945 RepID=A0ABT0X7R7_9ACTN|nr:trypsin-like peptidase domain-containing protein [Streptomyces meridianus]MCM2578572.1 trypsin-like peptidase domain-containing protein [Streptomyces meridianus]
MSTENEGGGVPPRPEPSRAPEAPEAAPSGAPATGSAARAEASPERPVPPVPEGRPSTGESSSGRGDDYRLPPPALPPTAERTAELPAAVGHASAGADDRPGSGAPGASGAQHHGHPMPPVNPPHAGPAYSTGGPAGGHWPPPPGDGSGGTGGWGGGHMPSSSSPRKGVGAVAAAVLAAALVAGGVGGGVGYWAAENSNSVGSTTVSSSGDPAAANRSPKSVAGIAQRALPSVVTIEAQGSQGDGGTGTGFVYDKQGHILTNNHVVASAAQGGKLTATFSNGKKYAAEVVGRAQGYDVAVIKLKGASDAELAPLPLGDSEKNVAVGDATIAIGAPFGLAGTVTTGIISAKNRPVASSDGGSNNASYMSALQTDASINPGNSGGPLLNAQGAVIGINSAIQSAGGGFGSESQQSGSIGLGFAIPINQAKRVAQNLIRTGEPVYPVIGVQVDMRQQGDGARIAESGNGGSAPVTPGGPAAKAGLKPGDVIKKLDDTVVDSGPTLISEIWTHKPGDRVTITYERNGKTATVDVTLGQRKGDS